MATPAPPLPKEPSSVCVTGDSIDDNKPDEVASMFDNVFGMAESARVIACKELVGQPHLLL